MRAKTFDCVEMKHRGAEKVREQTQDMTLEQELAFWHERSRVLKQHQKGQLVEIHEKYPVDKGHRKV